MRKDVLRATLALLTVFPLAACLGKVDEATTASQTPAAPGSVASPVDAPAEPSSGPEVVAGDFGVPSALALAGARVVIATRTTRLSGETVRAGGLFVADKRAGGHALMIDVDRRGASFDGLAVDGDTAFVSTSDGRVTSQSLDGGTPRTLATFDAAPTAIAARAGVLAVAGPAGALSEIDPVTGAVTLLATLDGEIRAVWAERGEVDVALAKGAGGSIVRVDRVLRTTSVLATLASAPCALARSRDRLFWTSSDVGEGQAPRGTVTSLSPGATTTSIHAEVSSFAGALSASGADLFFATTRDVGVAGAVRGAGIGLMRASIAGGAPSPVFGAAAPLAHAGTVESDASHVYWLSESALLRLAK